LAFRRSHDSGDRRDEAVVTTTRLPRLLHPGAWWLWASALAIAASRTTNPLLLAAIVAITGYVVAARRPATPWSASYAMFLKVGLLAIVIRVALFALLGGQPGTHILVRLPVVPLPSWLAGVRLGGPVSLEGILAAGYDGMRLGVIFCCIGAANALTSPRRLLKSLPGALYEAGVAVTVALAFAPQAVAAVGRLRSARRLRGRHDRGLRRIRGLAIPVLEGALERSVDLAAAMDARGFGRRGSTPATVRRTTASLTLGGLLAMVASSYGLVDRGAPTIIGVPLLIAGAALTTGGFALGARRGGRTRYRPDPWRGPEWLVAATGLAAAVSVFVGPTAALSPSTLPLVAPSLPLVPFVGLLLALLPAWLAPPLPQPQPAAARRLTAQPAREPAVAAS
jgi:energy-coupling factor transport system permease protein